MKSSLFLVFTLYFGIITCKEVLYEQVNPICLKVSIESTEK